MIPDALKHKIAEAPKPFNLAGRALFFIGGTLVIFGLFARVGLKAIEAASRGKVAVPQTLAQAYPTLPTWWIPEGVLGYFVATILIVTGLYLAIAAKQFMPRKGRRRR